MKLFYIFYHKSNIFTTLLSVVRAQYQPAWLHALRAFQSYHEAPQLPLEILPPPQTHFCESFLDVDANGKMPFVVINFRELYHKKEKKTTFLVVILACPESLEYFSCVQNPRQKRGHAPGKTNINNFMLTLPHRFQVFVRFQTSWNDCEFFNF